MLVYLFMNVNQVLRYYNTGISVRNGFMDFFFVY